MVRDVLVIFEVTCNGAATKEDAKIISKSGLLCSTLTKAAVFGKDANWGRILCAMGYSTAKFDPEKVDIYFESKAGKLKNSRKRNGYRLQRSKGNKDFVRK